MEATKKREQELAKKIADEKSAAEKLQQDIAAKKGEHDEIAKKLKQAQQEAESFAKDKEALAADADREK